MWVKKMVENGYLMQRRSVDDRRVIHVRLSHKGRALRDRLGEMHRWHIGMLPQAMIVKVDLESAALTLCRIERLWMRASNLVERSARFAA
jgi:DNA-binding MarR family transcriptional regulator